MAEKKKSQKTVKKQTGTITITEKEHEKLLKEAEANMKKHGFKTPEELLEYYESLRSRRPM